MVSQISMSFHCAEWITTVLSDKNCVDFYFKPGIPSHQCLLKYRWYSIQSKCPTQHSTSLKSNEASLPALVYTRSPQFWFTPDYSVAVIDQYTALNIARKLHELNTFICFTCTWFYYKKYLSSMYFRKIYNCVMNRNKIHHPNTFLHIVRWMFWEILCLRNRTFSFCKYD